MLGSGSSQVSSEPLGSTPGQAGRLQLLRELWSPPAMTGIHSARPITKSLTTCTVFRTETNTVGVNCRMT